MSKLSLMCQVVPNFLSYISATYYLNWFTVGKVITKIKWVNFLLRHSVYLFLILLPLFDQNIATKATFSRFRTRCILDTICS